MSESEAKFTEKTLLKLKKLSFLSSITSKTKVAQRRFSKYLQREDTSYSNFRHNLRQWLRFISRNRGQITYGFVVTLTVVLLIVGARVFSNRVNSSVSPGDLGALLSGLTSPILILWLIYSVRVQTQELREQKKTRKYSVAAAVLGEGKELLNSTIRSILNVANIAMEERSVFDLSEAPFVFLDKFVTPGAPLTLETDAPLHSSAKLYCVEYENISEILHEIDATGKTAFLLKDSPYGSIYRILKTTLA